MEAYKELLLESPLFHLLSEPELTHILSCLDVRYKEYLQSQIIIGESEESEEVGVVLDGEVIVYTIDMFGNRSITAKLGPKEVFGQVAASKIAAISPVSVEAKSDCTVLFLSFEKLVRPCSNACVFHSHVIKNMMHVLGERNLLISRKLLVLSQRTIREKLLAYLAWQKQQHNSNEFVIDFTREELADYLSVNRSALSREISSMVEEGLITTHRSHFTLLHVS